MPRGGFFGDGPLSSTSAGDPDSPISVHYQRFVRYDGPSAFTITIDSDHASNQVGHLSGRVGLPSGSELTFQRISEEDVLGTVRSTRGLERIDQTK